MGGHAGVGGAAVGGTTVGGGGDRGGSGGTGGDPEIAGAGGMGPDCSLCDPNAECTEANMDVTCACRAGFVGDGRTCTRPVSCDQLHRAHPQLPSGAYALKPRPAGAEFGAYCEMTAEGGGWTLILNEGSDFDPSALGVSEALCYTASCTSLAYSEVVLSADLMLDVANGPIEADDFEGRVVITGVQPATRGKTVRALFLGGPHYLEDEDNSNLIVRLPGNGVCSDLVGPLGDFAGLVCDSCSNGEECGASVLVLGDGDSPCAPEAPAFAIGGAHSHTLPWTNCAGWPQAPGSNPRHYPEHFRVWIR